MATRTDLAYVAEIMIRLPDRPLPEKPFYYLIAALDCADRERAERDSDDAAKEKADRVARWRASHAECGPQEGVVKFSWRLTRFRPCTEGWGPPPEDFATGEGYEATPTDHFRLAYNAGLSSDCCHDWHDLYLCADKCSLCGIMRERQMSFSYPNWARPTHWHYWFAQPDDGSTLNKPHDKDAK